MLPVAPVPFVSALFLVSSVAVVVVGEKKEGSCRGEWGSDGADCESASRKLTSEAVDDILLGGVVDIEPVAAESDCREDNEGDKTTRTPSDSEWRRWLVDR